jgi:hypothetical protein
MIGNRLKRLEVAAMQAKLLRCRDCGDGTHPCGSGAGPEAHSSNAFRTCRRRTTTAGDADAAAEQLSGR